MEFQLHHVAIIVNDTARALQFYQGILAMNKITRPDLGYPGAWLQSGAFQIHLLELDNPDEGLARPAHVGRDKHFAILVNDLDELIETLIAASWPFTRSRSGRAAIFCRDYDDNGIELIAASA